MVVEIAVQVAG